MFAWLVGIPDWRLLLIFRYTHRNHYTLGYNIYAAKHINSQVYLKRIYVQNIPIDKVRPNPFQLRVESELNELIQLCESIRSGDRLIHPITVRRQKDYYEIASGHRRWQACKRLSEKYIPAVVCDLTDQEMLETSLIENLQRRNLNPIEEAKGLAALKEKFNLSHKEVGLKVGRTQDYVAQRVRLLSLPDNIQGLLSCDKIGASAAEAIASKPSEIRTQLLSLIEKGWKPTVVQVHAYADAKKREEDQKSQPRGLTQQKVATR